MSDCCKRPKNPCMVCRRTVTAKTGLQCQGSCKSWIHFTCCSYTPGKIKDIKAKIIKVRCPCPDCSTQGPKEVLVKDSSFTCINKICPSNNPPKCTKHECPLNRMQQTSTCPDPCRPDPCRPDPCRPDPCRPDPCRQEPPCRPDPCRLDRQPPPEWPGVPCGNSCKKNTQQQQQEMEMDRRSHPIPQPPTPPMPQSQQQCPPPPCPSPPCRQPPPQQQILPPSSYPTSMPSTPPRHISPPVTPVLPSISLVENMCETVGVLSDQLNQLMVKMTDVLSPSSPGHSQHADGTTCRCPKNPRR